MEIFTEPVRYFMSSPVKSVAPDCSLADLCLRFQEFKVSCFGVTREVDGICEMLGVVTQSDLFHNGTVSGGNRLKDLTLADEPVTSIMSFDVVRISARDSLAHAAKSMVDNKVHRVFVEDDTGVVGVVSTRDIMRAINRARISTPLFEIMSSPVETVRSNQTIEDAIELMESAGISGLVVTDQGWPCGVFTQDEALSCKGLEKMKHVDQVMNPAMLVLPMTTPLFRAAANAASVDVRRIICSRGLQIAGVATGLDFCKAVMK